MEDNVCECGCPSGSQYEATTVRTAVRTALGYQWPSTLSQSRETTINPHVSRLCRSEEKSFFFNILPLLPIPSLS